jgi:hypothetical protein
MSLSTEGKSMTVNSSSISHPFDYIYFTFTVKSMKRRASTAELKNLDDLNSVTDCYCFSPVTDLYSPQTPTSNKIPMSAESNTLIFSSDSHGGATDSSNIQGLLLTNARLVYTFVSRKRASLSGWGWFVNGEQGDV